MTFLNGSLHDSDVLFDAEYDMGIILADLRAEYVRSPSPSLAQLIVDHGHLIDMLSDLRTDPVDRWDDEPAHSCLACRGEQND